MAVQSSHFPFWPIPPEGIPTVPPTWNDFMPVGVNSQGLWPSAVALGDGRVLVCWVEASGGVTESGARKDYAMYQKYVDANDLCKGNITPDGARLLARHDSTPRSEHWDKMNGGIGTMPDGRLFLSIAVRWLLDPVSIGAPASNSRNSNLWTSSDNGATWDYFTEVIPTQGSPYNASQSSSAAMGEMVVHPVSGNWMFLAPNYDDAGFLGVNIPETHLVTSTDDGVTWTLQAAGFHHAYGVQAGRNFGMSTSGDAFWNQDQNRTQQNNYLYWSINGNTWFGQDVANYVGSLIAWEDRETMWYLGGSHGWNDITQPLPANPFPTNYPGDFLWNTGGGAPLVQWGTGTRIHLFNQTQVACWGVPAGCPTPSLLHIPYKKWALTDQERVHQWTQNQLRIERWTMENAPDWDLLHLPYDMVFSPLHAEMNYLRLERYAQTQPCNCHPLHIPYKKWAYAGRTAEVDDEDAYGWQEEVNYFVIERWVKGLTQCTAGGAGAETDYYPPVVDPGTGCTFPALSTFPGLTTFPCSGVV